MLPRNTTCPNCGKKIIFSLKNDYLRCEDLSCPFLMRNICKVCNKGHYIYKVASHGFFQGIPFFQCNECKAILDNKGQ